MDSAAPEPQVDLTVGADDVVDGPATSKGHRGLDDTWDHFKKIKLDSNAAKTLHRNYDAICKGCAERVVGKPEKMRWHLVNCSKAAPTSQLQALKQQARRAGSHASQSCSQSNQGPDMDMYIDRVRVTPRQKETWWYLLAVAFIMTGWSFQTIKNPQFIDFMAHVRPNFELPSAYTLCGVCIDAALAVVKLKQHNWLQDTAMAYHLTLTLDGWSNDRMESIYS
ncbi:TPA: hypothetical protein ACH3X3_013031 [Trebouxia sp. C0006]